MKTRTWFSLGGALGAALITLVAACKQGPQPVPHQGGPPLPATETPIDQQPGTAERVSLGSNSARPSRPVKPDAAQASADEISGLAVSTSINAAKARLADAGPDKGDGDAGSIGPRGDASAPGGGSSLAEGRIGDALNGVDADLEVNPALGEVATLVFSASVAGELVPCGCSPDQRGGLPRAAGLLHRWREKLPSLIYIDAGDLLFAGPHRPQGSSAAQAELKARTLAQGAELLGAAGRVVGLRDLAEGPKFVAESAGKVPLLDAGAEVAGARQSLLVKAGPTGVPVGIFAAGLGANPEATIAARAAELHQQGARLVVLILQPRGDRVLGAAQRLLPAIRAAGVDLVLLGTRDDPLLDPNYSEAGSPPLLALEGHGQSLLRLDVIFPAGVKPGAKLWMPPSAEQRQADLDALEQRAVLLRQRLATADAVLRPQLEAKIAELEQRKQGQQKEQQSPPGDAIVVRARFRPLGADVPEDASARALVDAYDANVAVRNLEEAKRLPANCPRAKKGEQEFIGVSAEVKKGKSCASCHANQAAFWSRTRHARAYESLVAKGKQFSLECVACHTTGWQQPGGVCRIDRTDVGGSGLATPADRTGPGFADAMPAMLAVGRQGVQCEECHGPSSRHARSGVEISDDVPVERCRRCHEQQNSPHFDYAKYLPWITGPGHGEPLEVGQLPRTRGELDAGNKLGPNPQLHAQLQGPPAGARP